MVDKAIHMFTDLRQWEEAKVKLQLLELRILEHSKKICIEVALLL
jgi:hypothetical protein